MKTPVGIQGIVGNSWFYRLYFSIFYYPL